MSATFTNPDELNHRHGLDGPQLAMARFVEEAALARIKEILERMGVEGILREDTMAELVPKMLPHKISIAHLTGAEDGSDGWWLRRDGKAEVHIEAPVIVDGMINFRARFLR